MGSKKCFNGRNNLYDFDWSSYLKVVGNEKEGGSRRWQMMGIGLRPRRSRFVCLKILLSSLILCISVSAPVKKNE
jgi:hypothetical protein